jgi:NAD(P)-dependent dehydrogenase (short-subunit alcohol dehydrogenase family)
MGQGALDGRTALVTGANRGIGRAIAEGLASLGATVLVGARAPASAVEVAEAIRASGGSADPLVLDVAEPGSVASAAEDVARRGLDILVNNAAIKLEHHPSPPSGASLADVQATLDVNVVGTIRVIQAMLPTLLRSDRPRIVNLSSGLGSLTYATTPGSRYQERPLVSYSTSKAAVNMVTVLFANEFSTTPLRVNAVDPGPVNTPMTQGKASRTPVDGARPVLDAVLIANDGPTGCFFDERGEVPW